MPTPTMHDRQPEWNADNDEHLAAHPRPNLRNPSPRPPWHPRPKPPIAPRLDNRIRLLAALGFAKDPFNQCVTERETDFQFNEIYVEVDESLLDRLSDHAESVFCFADYGMGKSATRLALEYKLRLEPAYEQTLCVRYTPAYREIATKSQETLHEDLCHEIAMDCLIQVVERSQRQIQRFDAPFLQALRYQTSMLPTAFRRFLQAEPPGADRHDGVFWPTILRPVVESISPSQTWQTLMDTIRPASLATRPFQADWDESIGHVHALGFKQIFILIDAVDELKQHPERWIPFLNTLFEFLPEWHDQGVFVKCFLPTAVQNMFLDRYQRLIEGLTPVAQITTIGATITETHLEQILLERLAAVKTQPFQETRLSVLIGVHLPESIEGWLARQAHGSPRRVLELASRFLDFHADHVYSNGGRLDISPAEWTRYKASVGERSP